MPSAGKTGEIRALPRRPIGRPPRGLRLAGGLSTILAAASLLILLLPHPAPAQSAPGGRVAWTLKGVGDARLCGGVAVAASTEWLRALNLSTGAVLWEYRFPERVYRPLVFCVNGTPVVLAENRLYSVERSVKGVGVPKSVRSVGELIGDVYEYMAASNDREVVLVWRGRGSIGITEVDADLNVISESSSPMRLEGGWSTGLELVGLGDDRAFVVYSSSGAHRVVAFELGGGPVWDVRSGLEKVLAAAPTAEGGVLLLGPGQVELISANGSVSWRALVGGSCTDAVDAGPTLLVSSTDGSLYELAKENGSIAGIVSVSGDPVMDLHYSAGEASLALWHGDGDAVLEFWLMRPGGPTRAWRAKVGSGGRIIGVSGDAVCYLAGDWWGGKTLMVLRRWVLDATIEVTQSMKRVSVAVELSNGDEISRWCTLSVSCPQASYAESRAVSVSGGASETEEFSFEYGGTGDIEIAVEVDCGDARLSRTLIHRANPSLVTIPPLTLPVSRLAAYAIVVLSLFSVSLVGSLRYRERFPSGAVAVGGLLSLLVTVAGLASRSSELWQYPLIRGSYYVNGPTVLLLAAAAKLLSSKWPSKSSRFVSALLTSFLALGGSTEVIVSLEQGSSPLMGVNLLLSAGWIPDALGRLASWVRGKFGEGRYQTRVYDDISGGPTNP